MSGGSATGVGAGANPYARSSSGNISAPNSYGYNGYAAGGASGDGRARYPTYDAVSDTVGSGQGHGHGQMGGYDYNAASLSVAPTPQYNMSMYANANANTSTNTAANQYQAQGYQQQQQQQQSYDYNQQQAYNYGQQQQMQQQGYQQQGYDYSQQQQVQQQPAHGYNQQQQQQQQQQAYQQQYQQTATYQQTPNAFPTQPTAADPAPVYDQQQPPTQTTAAVQSDTNPATAAALTEPETSVQAAAFVQNSHDLFKSPVASDAVATAPSVATLTEEKPIVENMQSMNIAANEVAPTTVPEPAPVEMPPVAAATSMNNANDLFGAVASTQASALASASAPIENNIKEVNAIAQVSVSAADLFGSTVDPSMAIAASMAMVAEPAPQTNSSNDSLPVPPMIVDPVPAATDGAGDELPPPPMGGVEDLGENDDVNDDALPPPPMMDVAL
uniref:Uncharacterized protein n=1 Tax=Chaetoceros debilis TaxID=122233 RepID=A0A7S3Q3Y2_9STRA